MKNTKKLRISLKKGQEKEVNQIKIKNEEVVYEHSADYSAVVGYFTLTFGKDQEKTNIELGKQYLWKGFLFTLVGEHSGTVELEIVKIENE